MVIQLYAFVQIKLIRSSLAFEPTTVLHELGESTVLPSRLEIEVWIFQVSLMYRV